MDAVRNKILQAGAVATAIATAKSVLAQQAGQDGDAGTSHEKGAVRIRYEDTGDLGFPLLLIAD